jgi:3-oxocholest-4-en-26-oyl-CoA dehydrogenase beta subunit
MDLAPTSQQQLLAATARSFLDRRCPPSLVLELALDPRGFREDLWREMAGLGWPGLLAPSALGGSDGSLLDVMVLVEEMGRACLPSPYIQSAVVATSLLLATRGAGRRPGAGPDPVDRLVADLASGDRIATPAVLEGAGALSPDAIALRAEVPGRITGRKLFVKDAHVADVLVLVARGGGGFNLLAIEPGRPGLRIEPMPSMAGEKLSAVALDDVPVAAADLVGAPGRSWDAMAPALERGALARCAEMVGCAARVLDLCVAHARGRVQSGRPIGSFQAIQHACADLLRDVEGARWLAYQAAWKAQQAGGAPADVAMAKAFCGEACLRVARRAHQIMGAIGYCEEHPLHLLHKRILAASLDFGDSTSHLDAVARAIGLSAVGAPTAV